MLPGKVRITSLVLFLACSATARSEQITFTILQINDVYEILPAKPGDLGGLDRVAALRRRLEAERGEDRVLLVLAGDCFSPSVMGKATRIEGGKATGERLAGRQMVAVLNSLGPIYATFGNHEFDWKADEFRDRVLESTNIRWFSSNVRESALPRSVPPGVELTVPGRSKGCSVRLGMLGLTLDFKGQGNDEPAYAAFDDFSRAARDQVQRLRDDRCDVIVAVTHLKLEEDKQLAQDVPGIHLIVGGHEHQNHYEAQRFDPPGPPIAKADANARTAYIHDFSYDTERGELEVRSTLRFVDESIGSDPATARQIVYWKHVAFDLLRQEAEGVTSSTKYGVVKALRDAHKVPGQLTNGDLESPTIRVGVQLEGREEYVRTRPTNLTRFVLEVMWRKAGDDVDLAILNSGSIRIDDVIPPAGLSIYDIFRILPYEVKVHRVRMKGALIRRLLEAGRKNKREGSFLQFANYDYEKNQLINTQKSMSPDTAYTVAIGHFVLGGGEKDLQAVLPPREIGQLSKLKLATNDEIELLGTDPKFDLLTALAEELARIDPKAGTPAGGPAPVKIEPSDIASPAGEAGERKGQKESGVARFRVPVKRCEPREDVASADSPVGGLIDHHAARGVASLDDVKTAVESAIRAGRREPRASGDARMMWWQVLLVFAVAGLLGGGLATVRWFNPTNPRSDGPSWRPGWSSVLLYNTIIGAGGALAILLFMVLDQKIKTTVGSQELLSYSVIGFFAGFLGPPLVEKFATGRSSR